MASKNVAFVDDNELGTEAIMELLGLLTSGITYKNFTTCEQLTSAMNTGKRYDLYVLDFQLDEEGFVYGTSCVPKIKAIHPEAVFIGRSANDNAARQFALVGVTEFINKVKDGQTFADTIIRLIT